MPLDLALSAVADQADDARAARVYAALRTHVAEVLGGASAESPEISLMNWPRQDYAAESILDRTPIDLARILQLAKRISLAFLYWLQHDQQHPELMLRPGCSYHASHASME